MLHHNLKGPPFGGPFLRCKRNDAAREADLLAHAQALLTPFRAFLFEIALLFKRGAELSPDASLEFASLFKRGSRSFS